MHIFVLALNGLFDTGLSVTLDAFSAANKLSARMMGGTPHFDVSIVGVRKRVLSENGLVVPVQPIVPDLKPEWVIVPALTPKAPPELVANLERPDVVRS